jgi:hypothetical protein
MKTLREIINRSSSVSTSIAIMLAIASAITFWFATAPRASAATCTVCHKNTTTISGLDCGGLDYRRHIDHGDTNGACVTPSGNQ